MAQGSPLTTIDRVKKQLNIGQHGTLNTYDDDLLTDLVYSASAMIETECGRNFTAWGNGTLQRQYDHAYPTIDGRILYLDTDLLSVGTLLNDGNANNGTITSDKYRLLPTNESPKYAIELKQGTGYAWTHDESPQEAIKVIGTWGYSTTAPLDVQEATTMLAKHLYLTRDNDGSIAVADGFSVVPADAPNIVFKTIRRYVRQEIRG